MANLAPPKPTLFNAPPTDRILEKENFLAREVLYLKLAGRSHSEIAKQLNKTITWISTVCRQPWFVEEMIRHLHHRGENEINKVIKSVCDDAIAVAQALMHNPEVSPSVRASCAFEFIKAHRGQKVIVENKTTSLSELNAEEKRLKEEVAELEGINRATSGN